MAAQVGSPSSGGAARSSHASAQALRFQPPCKPADVFAYGVVLWELLTWQLPWIHEQDPWRVRQEGCGLRFKSACRQGPTAPRWQHSQLAAMPLPLPNSHLTTPTLPTRGMLCRL